MSWRLSEEMMDEIALSALAKGKCILLVKSAEQADKIQVKVRAAMQKGLTDHTWPLVRGKPPVVKPGDRNPNFVQVTNGGWVFIWAVDDMDPNESLGQPEIVYWPSEGGVYEKVTYDLWKQQRLVGNVYRPVTVAAAKRSKKGERPTAWEHILGDDE